MRTYRLSLLLMLFSGGLIIQQSYGNVATTAIRKVSNNAAIVIRSGGIDSLFYIYTDHQGSILQLNNEAGAIVEQRVYDPWGRERTLGNWSNYLTDAGYRRTDRGYIGQEHLPQFGLINLNARLYDPVVGRFLSADPFVQNPLFSQNFNRYSYSMNNPVIYSDPSGEYALIDDLIAAVLGGAVNVVVNAFQGNIHSWGQGFSYFGVGAAGTWVGLYGGPLASGAIIGAGNSFVTQGFGNNGGWNWSNINPGQVGISTIMGAGTGFISSEVSGLISPYVDNLFSGVGGQAVQQGLTQGVTGSVTGFTIGTGFALANGDNLGEALKIGGQSALTGFAIGSATGIANGMRSAYEAGENPWTGKSNIDVTADDLGLTPTMDRIQAGESYPHRNDGSTFRNDQNILPAYEDGYYKEYVHPTPGVDEAGLQRIIIGGNGKVYYYSPDHYRTFIRFKY